jgi:hypothetical protein
MDKQLEGLPERVEEHEAKLASLRDMLRRSIERGGSYTDEEVGASVSAALDARERDRKSA